MAFMDTTKVEKMKGGFDLLPKGKYRVLVTGAEEKTSQKGGKYIAITYDVVEGPFKGRKIWHNFTTKNDNPQAVAIGQSDLAKFIEGCGFTGEVKDEAHFFKIVMDQVLWLDVGIRKDKRTGEERQSVFDWLCDKPKADDATLSDVPPPTDNEIPF